MEAEINLKYEGHAKTSEIKKLILESETSGVGCYKVIAEWPNGNSYFRIGFKAQTNEISYIDFDGGPWLTYGSSIKNKYIVTGFKHDGNFENVKILLTECSS